jgi:putative ABC transport system substrate-binding protein
MSGMGRREFVALVGGAAAWPVAARAQQPAIPVIGFLSSASPGGYAFFVTAFRNGLKEAGYIEGRNVAVEYRWAEGQLDRLAALAADLVSRKVAVILAGGSVVSVQAAMAATKTIPIVLRSRTIPWRRGLLPALTGRAGTSQASR